MVCEPKLVVGKDGLGPRIRNFENPALGGKGGLRVLGVGQIGPPDKTGFARRDINRSAALRLGSLDVFCDVGAQVEKRRLLDQDLVQFLPLWGGGRAVFLQLFDGGKSFDVRVLGLVMLDAGELVSFASLCDAAHNRAGLLHIGILDAGCQKNLVCHSGR